MSKKNKNVTYLDELEPISRPTKFPNNLLSLSFNSMFEKLPKFPDLGPTIMPIKHKRKKQELDVTSTPTNKKIHEIVLDWTTYRDWIITHWMPLPQVPEGSMVNYENRPMGCYSYEPEFPFAIEITMWREKFLDSNSVVDRYLRECFLSTPSQEIMQSPKEVLEEILKFCKPKDLK